MGVTISTHNGTAANREHNKRNRRVTDKEAHINRDGVHENWIDEGVGAAYSRIFGEAVKRYNEKQKRPERRIKDYYRTVCDNKKQHPVYEMIVGIYGKDENGQPLCTVEQGKAILRQFVDDWKERNPNLELIGAYYHADEQGEPHVHLDYVPVAHGYKRGLDTQTGLVKALGEQGFIKDGSRTAQIQWEARENAYLTELCERTGLEVDHPKTGTEHLQTEIFKLQQELSKLQGQVLTEKEVNEIKGKKSFTGALKGVSYEEYLSLKKTAAAVEKSRAANKKLKSSNSAKDKKIADLKEQLEILPEQLRKKFEDEFCGKYYVPNISEMNKDDIKRICDGRPVFVKFDDGGNMEIKFSMSEKKAVEQIIEAIKSEKSEKAVQKNGQQRTFVLTRETIKQNQRIIDDKEARKRQEQPQRNQQHRGGEAR